MTHESQPTDDKLVANLLRRSERDTDAVDHESAEDLFELFVEGRLTGADAEEFFNYLDANPEAREAASEYLAWTETSAEEAPATVELAAAPTAARSWVTRTATVAMALAACLLLAIGIDFGGARGARGALLARHSGVERLSLLENGYDLDGAQAMDGLPEGDELAALQADIRAFEAIDADAAAAFLPRAQLAIRQNEPDAALEWADRALDADPENAEAHLARAVALFLRDDLEQAEASVRDHLERSPKSFAGRINLAMVLLELDRTREALDALRAIDPADAPSDDVRAAIAAKIDELAAAAGEER